MRKEKTWALVLFWLLAGAIIFSTSAWAALPVGEARAVSGDVQALPHGSSAWERIGVGHVIHPGDTLRTGSASKASVLCVDESQIKLGENTIMVFKNAAPSPRLGFKPVSMGQGSKYGVEQGQVWLRNIKEDFSFELTTPAVNAAIRGTEFIVGVAKDGLSTISLLQGRLDIFNDFGNLDLQAGEIALARPGEPPRKQLLLQPDDAVQWVLYYPDTGILRAVSLAGLGLSPAGPAMRAYDQGNLALARQLAQNAGPRDSVQAATVLGFLDLWEGRDQEALRRFEDVLKTTPDTRAAAGRCLALYHRGAQDRAHAGYEEILKAIQTPDTLALGAFFALMTGKPERAMVLLDQALSLAPNHVGGQALRAQLDLVANRKAEARIRAEQTLAANPESALTLVSAGLADIAHFDLPKARQRMTQAAHLDPSFVEPLIYLARLQLGSEHLDQARTTLDRALAIAPREASVLSMDGFLWLATRDYEAAERSFLAAIQTDPALGDPHLGLGLCAYAHGDETTGLREMLTATLLDPRVSQFQSMLGKSFFQSKAFDKALATFDYASQLDPNDPTPHLYKGIVLTNLNRPGEAIREINTSIAKNDNQAVFRSSLMLDRDFAIRNSNLAESYTSLGLGEWAYSKALTAVKKDPLNYSAHYFLSSAFAATRQRVSSDLSEVLLYRMLAPANQNAFHTLDYSPMFESPYISLITMGSVGAWSNGNAIDSGLMQLFCSTPGFASYIQSDVSRDEGMRESNGERQTTLIDGTIKWEPTNKDSLFINPSFFDTTSGDLFYPNDWKYETSPFFDQNNRTRSGEFGYVHHFSPEATLLLYARQGFNSWDNTDGSFDPEWLIGDDWIVSEKILQERERSLNSSNIQIQQQLAYEDHTFMIGFNYFIGKYSEDARKQQEYWMKWPQLNLDFCAGDYMANKRYSFTQDSINLYIHDYWNPIKNVIVELGISTGHASSLRYMYKDPVDSHFIGTRLGVNWEVTSKDIIRFAVQKYLNTQLTYGTTLQATEVAGFPSWFNADDGAEISEAGLAWERQWNDLTYSVMRLSTYDVDDPQYCAQEGELVLKNVGTRRYQASAHINRILTPALGLSTAATFKRLLPNDITLDYFPNTDFTEANLTAGLFYLHESGVRFSIEETLIHQHFADDAAQDMAGNSKQNETFGILSIGCEYEFPEKRGHISLYANNIFNEHAFQELETGTLDPYEYPDRKVLLTMSLRF